MIELLCYNDPWLPDLVPRAAAGEQLIDSIDFSLAPKAEVAPASTAQNVVE